MHNCALCHFFSEYPKEGKQIAGVANSFIASADEEYVLGNKIPLWLFGFMY